MIQHARDVVRQWAPRIVYGLLILLGTIGGWWISRVEAQLYDHDVLSSRVAVVEATASRLDDSVTKLDDILRRLERVIGRLEGSHGTSP